MSQLTSICSSRTYLLVSVPTVNINEKGGVPTTAPFCTTSRVLTCRSCTVSMSLRGATHKNHTSYDSSLLSTSEWQYQFICSSFEFMGDCNTAMPPRWILSSITPRFHPIRHDTLVPHCLHQVAPVLVVSSSDQFDRVFDMHTPPQPTNWSNQASMIHGARFTIKAGNPGQVLWSKHENLNTGNEIRSLPRHSSAPNAGRGSGNVHQKICKFTPD